MIVLIFLAVTASKAVAVVSDPYNGIVTPKAIPGAKLDYTITVTNGTLAVLDQDKTIISDPIPAKVKLCLTDLGILNSGPVAFTSVLSNLSFTYTALNNTLDDVEFSNNSGSTYAYTPSADSDGCDATVTNIRIKPKGKLAIAGSASFRFRVMVK